MSDFVELVTKLNDKSLSASDRAEAAAALGASGEPGALDVLIQALRDEADEVKVAAAKALGEIGDEQASAGLEELLASESAGVRNAAQDALDQIGADEGADSSRVKVALGVVACAVAVIVALALRQHFEKAGTDPSGDQPSGPTEIGPAESGAPGADTPGAQVVKPGAPSGDASPQKKIRVGLRGAESVRISNLATKHGVSLDALHRLWEYNYSSDDIGKSLELMDKYQKNLGEVIALRKFPGRGEVESAQIPGKVKDALEQGHLWSLTVGKLLEYQKEPMSWPDIERLLEAEKQWREYGADLETILRRRKEMSWGDIETVLKYCQQYGKNLHELVELRKQYSLGEIEYLLKTEKEREVNYDRIRKLRVRCGPGTVKQVLDLREEVGQPVEQINEMLQSQNFDEVKSALTFAKKYGVALYTVQELRNAWDWTEINTLLTKAAEWKIDAEELAKYRNDLSWKDLEKAQATVVGFITQKKGTATLAKVVEAHLKSDATWGQIGTALALAHESGFTLAEILEFSRGREPEDMAAAIATAKKFNEVKLSKLFLLRGGRTWQDVAKELQEQKKDGLGAALPRVDEQMAKGEHGKAARLMVFGEDEQANDAERKEWDAVLAQTRSREWEEVAMILTKAAEWKIDDTELARHRVRLTWQDLEAAQKLMVKFNTDSKQQKVSFEKLLELAKTMTWDDINRALAVSDKFGLPLEDETGKGIGVLELWKGRDWAEVEHLLTNAKTWKMAPKQIAEFRQSLDWEDIEKAQKLAEQYVKGLELLIALRKTVDMDEIDRLLKYEKACDVNFMTVHEKWRRSLDWDQLNKALEIYIKHKAVGKIGFIVEQRLEGENWDDIEKSVKMPEPAAEKK